MSKNVKIFLDKNIDSHIIGSNKVEMMNSGLMTIDDLAKYLKITRRTIYEWLKQNKIPAVKLVGQWRFRKDKIDDWLDQKSLH